MVVGRCHGDEPWARYAQNPIESRFLSIAGASVLGESGVELGIIAQVWIAFERRINHAGSHGLSRHLVRDFALDPDAALQLEIDRDSVQARAGRHLLSVTSIRLITAWDSRDRAILRLGKACKPVMPLGVCFSLRKVELDHAQITTL